MNHFVTKLILPIVFIGTSLMCSTASPIIGGQQTENPPKTKRFDLFNHLDLGVTLGTTGVGVDFALPVGDMVKVRAGVAYMPPVKVPLHFDIMSYNGSEAVSEGTFAKAQELLKTMTGFDINKEVTVDGKPDMLNFKLLIDVYPFKNNKHWPFTAGVYAGPKRIATAVNSLKDAPTLVGVGMYNSLYDFFNGSDEYGAPLYMSKPIYGDYYIDPDVGDAMAQKLSGYGRMGVHMGDYKGTGKPFMMIPGNDATLRAEALVDKFRPYIGFGYGGFIDKAKRFSVSVECGAMFWGGHPKIVTYNGAKDSAEDADYPVDLTRDVENIGGKVGDYVKLIKALKVYPVLDFRISYRIF